MRRATSVPPLPTVPNERERDLAKWAFTGDDAELERVARYFAHYRAEILRPFEELAEDYRAIGDGRVETDLRRIIVSLRGEP
jgi:hypothetical protein